MRCNKLKIKWGSILFSKIVPIQTEDEIFYLISILAYYHLYRYDNTLYIFYSEILSIFFYYKKNVFFYLFSFEK